MADRTAFCPYCRSVQPLKERREGDQVKWSCSTCGASIEGGSGEELPLRLTVLCVDDDRLVLGYLADALERAGYRTLVATDGPTAIEIANRERPDAILLDLLLPGMSGFDLCRQLRREPKLQETPIILLTALDDPSVSITGREAGATVALRKPFGSASIISTLEQVLRSKAAPPIP